MVTDNAAYARTVLAVGFRQNFSKTALSTILPEEIEAEVKEAAEIWGQSPKATRRYFREVEGVRIIRSPESRKAGRRARRYETVLIPPAVLEREIHKVAVSIVSP